MEYKTSGFRTNLCKIKGNLQSNSSDYSVNFELYFSLEDLIQQEAHNPWIRETSKKAVTDLGSQILLVFGNPLKDKLSYASMIPLSRTN